METITIEKDKLFERYYLNGKLHRTDGPAKVEYYDNGQISLEEHHINGLIHRDDGPAVEQYFVSGERSSVTYYKNGKPHNENGAAHVRYYESGATERYEYWLNHQRHSVDGPAVITFYDSGKYHEFKPKSKTYYVDYKIHRIDGPAWIEYSESGETVRQSFYLEGHEYTESEYLRRVAEINNENNKEKNTATVIKGLIEKIESELKDGRKNVYDLEINLSACRQVLQLLS